MKNLENLSKEEILDFLKSFEYVVFDVDGVLQYTRDTISGSDLCVQNLRRLGKKVVILSNNTITPRKGLVARLKDFEVTDDELVSPNEALLSYLKKINFDKDIYMISGQNPKDLVKEAGYNVVDIKPDTVDDSITALKNDCLEAIKNYPNIGAIVVDFDINFTLLQAHRAITLLNHYKDIILLCGAEDDTGPIAQGVLILGPKFYVDAVRRLGNKKGLSYAKPSQLLTNHLNKKYDITDSKKVLFVGDNYDVDVAFGNSSGYQTLLVLSGYTLEDDIPNLKEKSELVKPNFYVKSLKELNDLMVQHCLE